RRHYSRQAVLFSLRQAARSAARPQRASSWLFKSSERVFLLTCGARLGSQPTHYRDSRLGRRARVSSEGAAGASAAARRRGAANRKVTLQARAPEEDTRARLTGRKQSYAPTTGATPKS